MKRPLGALRTVMGQSAMVFSNSVRRADSSATSRRKSVICCRDKAIRPPQMHTLANTIPPLRTMESRYFRLNMSPRLRKREVMFLSNSAILLWIAFSVVLSAVFDDADKLLLKLSNCCRVRLSISWASCSVLALMRSVRDCSEVPLLSIYSSFEAQFFPAVGVFDGDIVLASPVDGKSCLLQGGKHILPIADKLLFQFGRHIGVNGLLGLVPFILAGRLAPADQPCPVQVGVFRGMQTGAGGIVRSGPLLPVVMEIAEYAEGFFPARREGIEGVAACQFHPWNDKMEFVMPGVAVPHPEDIALIRLQPGKGYGLKIVHDPFFLFRRHLVVGMPGQNTC